LAFIFDGGTVDANSGLDITTDDAFIVYGGDVGIGMINPSVELDVTGDIEYTGTIADVSDRRMKKDIKDLPAGQLQEILNLNSVSFRMKDDPKWLLEFGFIAQDVQIHHPDLVDEDSEGILSMNYIGLIAPMAEAIKEQNILINQQREMIEDLKIRTKALQEAQRNGKGR